MINSIGVKYLSHMIFESVKENSKYIPEQNMTEMQQNPDTKIDSKIDSLAKTDLFMKEFMGLQPKHIDQFGDLFINLGKEMNYKMPSFYLTNKGRYIQQNFSVIQSKL